MTLEEFQSRFSRTKHWIHLNNAGFMPITRSAKDSVQYWVNRFYEDGMHCNDDYLSAAANARLQLAHFLHCKPSELAYFQSTAGAISQVAFGMDLQPDDEVLTWDQEYGSNLYPWQEACRRSCAKLVHVSSEKDLATPAESILNAITQKTRVIAISWVQFQTGAITDLEKIVKIAKEKNIWTVIDGIQGLGLFPFDFAASGVDAICGGSHKWLASPIGVGFLAVREERLSQLKPLMVGTQTYGTCNDPTSLVCLPKTTAEKFEAGSRQVLEIIALGESVQALQSFGVSKILSETERLSEKLSRGLAARGFTVHSPFKDRSSGSIVNFSGLNERVKEIFQLHKISFAERGPGIRLSPHALNSEADIDFTLETLSRYL